MAGIVERVVGILVRPRRTWATVDQEPTAPAALYLRYIAPLAGLAALARLIGVMFVGFPAAPPLPWLVAVPLELLYFGFELLAVLIVAYVIDWLGPRLGCPECEGVSTHRQALKVAAYARTPLWIAGLVAIVPALQFIALIIGSLYAVYLLWLGLPELMKAPRHRIPVYTLLTVVAAAGFYGLIRALLEAILAMVFGFAVDARDYTP